MIARIAHMVIVLTISVGSVGCYATEADRAAAAWGGVSNTFGSSEQLNDNAFEGLASDAPVSTVDGADFAVKLECEASPSFLTVGISLTPTSDIAQITTLVDLDFDGTSDSSATHTGDFGAVCNNGVIKCDPGTMDNCAYLQWKANGPNVSLEPVFMRDLGACYCFNDSCGNNLALQNTRKILDDVGVGVGIALQREQPRLSLGNQEYPNNTTVTFFGQEAGCRSDSRPEQYAGDASQLQAAGVAESQDPNSQFYWLQESTVAQNHGVAIRECTIERQIVSNQITFEEIIELQGRTTGSTALCGSNCRVFHLGRSFEWGNYWSGPSGWGLFNCAIYTEEQSFRIMRPDLLVSVEQQRIRFDDSIQIIANNNLVFADPANWTLPTGSPPFCERSRNFDYSPQLNLTPLFKSKNRVDIKYRVAVGGTGRGAGEIRIETQPTACEIGYEAVQDNCQVPDQDQDCRIRDEWVDGVQTISSFLPTGLQPLQSSKPVYGECDYGEVERPFWGKRRVYACDTGTTTFDGQIAIDRYQAVHNSYNANDGSFTDDRVDENGVVTTHSMIAPQFAPTAVACTPMCKTRRRQPGAFVTESGASSEQNNTGTAWDYNYYECTGTTKNVCPLVTGDELVEPCNCDNNFNDAASIMATVRMMSQDSKCIP